MNFKNLVGRPIVRGISLALILYYGCDSNSQNDAIPDTTDVTDVEVEGGSVQDPGTKTVNVSYTVKQADFGKQLWVAYQIGETGALTRTDPWTIDKYRDTHSFTISLTQEATYLVWGKLGTYPDHPTWDNFTAITITQDPQHPSYDIDGDGISNDVEGENDQNYGTYDPVTPISYQGNTYYYAANSADYPPVITNQTHPHYNTHDYSLEVGSVSTGSLTNGLRLANFSAGYYDKNAYLTTPNPNYIHDEHNWGTLYLINIIEKVARQWDANHQGGPRIGVGDLSLRFGGTTLDHTQHANGLEVDVRYVRNDGAEGGLDFDVNPDDYSQTETQSLIDLFRNESNVCRILIDSRANLQGSKLRVRSGHNHHFHVWLIDPDETNDPCDF